VNLCLRHGRRGKKTPEKKLAPGRWLSTTIRQILYRKKGGQKADTQEYHTTADLGPQNHDRHRKGKKKQNTAAKRKKTAKKRQLGGFKTGHNQSTGELG